MAKIFISYRRVDSLDIASRIAKELTSSFGKNSVFVDHASIPAGEDYRLYLDQTVRQAKVLVALIGQQWKMSGADGRANAEPSDDFVRIEIETALRAGLKIIPVLIGSASMPDARNLPASIKSFASRQAIEINSKDFDYHFEKLVEAIEKVIGPRHAKAGLTRKRLVVGGGVAVAAMATAVLLFAVNLNRTQIGPPPPVQNLDVTALPSATSVQEKLVPRAADPVPQSANNDAPTKGERRASAAPAPSASPLVVVPGHEAATPLPEPAGAAPAAEPPRAASSEPSAEPPRPAPPAQPAAKSSPAPQDNSLLKSAALASRPAPLGSSSAQPPAERAPREEANREPPPKAAPPVRIVTAIEGESFVLCGQPDFTLSMYQPRPNSPTVVSLRRSGMMLADGLSLQLSPGKPRNVVGNCDVAFVEVKQGFRPIVVLEEQRR